MPVVKMKLKDAIRLSLEKERLTNPNYKKFDIYKHVAGMPIQDEELIIALWTKGNTYHQIQKETGYCYATIGRKIRNYKKTINTGNMLRAGAVPKLRVAAV